MQRRKVVDPVSRKDLRTIELIRPTIRSRIIEIQVVVGSIDQLRVRNQLGPGIGELERRVSMEARLEEDLKRIVPGLSAVRVEGERVISTHVPHRPERGTSRPPTNTVPATI